MTSSWVNQLTVGYTHTETEYSLEWLPWSPVAIRLSPWRYFQLRARLWRMPVPRKNNLLTLKQKSGPEADRCRKHQTSALAFCERNNFTIEADGFSSQKANGAESCCLMTSSRNPWISASCRNVLRQINRKYTTRLFQLKQTRGSVHSASI